MKIQAVIFDLNGTVLSDEYNYGYAFKRVLIKLGARVTSDYPHIGGIGVSENWPGLLKKYKVKTKKTAEELAAMTQNEYIAQIDEIELNQGFLDFVRDLRDSDIPIALATSNTWNVVEQVLTRFDLNNYFDTITTKEEIERNKPDPSIFLVTADKLMVDPKNCLVFEDSSSGVEAAIKAGMWVIAIARDQHQRESLTKADKIINDFTEITPKILESLN